MFRRCAETSMVIFGSSFGQGVEHRPPRSEEGGQPKCGRHRPRSSTLDEHRRRRRRSRISAVVGARPGRLETSNGRPHGAGGTGVCLARPFLASATAATHVRSGRYSS